MALIQWNAASGGLFNSLLNWLGGLVPGASDTAVLGALGAPYTVVSQAGALGLPLGGTQAIGALETAAGSTLRVLGGIDLLGLTGGMTNFLAAAGTGGGANLGTVDVENALYTAPVVGTLLGGSANFEIGGVFDNAGAILLNGQPTARLPAADQKSILTILGPVTLDGGGVITLSNDAFNLITGGSGAILTNVDNLISGAGKITGLGLINEAAGAIVADQGLPFVVSGLGTTINAGLLEATHGGTLKLGGNIDNLGGQILAEGGRVILSGVTITDGTLASSVFGAFVIQNIGNGLTGGGLNGVNLDGVIVLYENANLTISGAINNFGKLLIQTGRGASTTELLVSGAGAILSGGGQIFLAGASSLITGVTSAATLTNLDNLITGGGLLGAGALTLINGLAGVIEGAGPTGLTLDTGANTIQNAGLIAGGRGSQTLGEERRRQHRRARQRRRPAHGSERGRRRGFGIGRRRPARLRRPVRRERAVPGRWRPRARPVAKLYRRDQRLFEVRGGHPRSRGHRLHRGRRGELQRRRLGRRAHPRRRRPHHHDHAHRQLPRRDLRRRQRRPRRHGRRRREGRSRRPGRRVHAGGGVSGANRRPADRATDGRFGGRRRVSRGPSRGDRLRAVGFGERPSLARGGRERLEPAARNRFDVLSAPHGRPFQVQEHPVPQG